jgi:hypothetical protein
MTIASTPWSITSGTTHSSLWVVAKGGRLVAEVWSGAGAKVKIANMAAMASANARVIAAAPDMIDALRQWRNAEREGDEAEMANARISRDLIIAKVEDRSA